VLEYSAVDAVLIRCFAQPAVLDGFPGIAGAAACRVANDELMLLGAPTKHATSLDQATAHFESQDPDALVIAHSEAWSFWAISGPAMRRAFARLSANALPPTGPALIQGALARLPGKALLLSDRILLMAPSQVGHHLPERIRAACADLNPQERGVWPFEVEGAILVASSGARAAHGAP